MSSPIIHNHETIQRAVISALRAWKKLDGTSENFLEDFLLVRKKRYEMAQHQPEVEFRTVTNQILSSCIDLLATQDEINADILSKRFQDGETILSVAHQLNLSPDQVNRRQRQAISELSKILYRQETKSKQLHAQRLESKLQPQSYSKLFGFNQSQTIILERMLDPDETWVIALAGLGGIGKSALADAVTRSAIQQIHFEEIIWLRVNNYISKEEPASGSWFFEFVIQQLASRLLPPDTPPTEYLEQIQILLKKAPHLIILDNLEIEHSTNELLLNLNNLANPSKFLITTRSRPSSESEIFIFTLNEISYEEVNKLLIHQAEIIGISNMSEDLSQEIKTIYRVTGGNPLALKLVVGLIAVLPLSQVLEDLINSQTEDVEKMYTNIYWKAWQALSLNSKKLLQALPLISESGGQLDQLQAVSGLSTKQVGLSVQELVTRSLLEMRGTLNQRRYGIHRLTETFLRTEIIKWKDGPI
ncbi:MAG: hypothetical protein FVQ83_10310 [Chloroflexi bacterium]|nr:hypothetical protein [Chloroflexota bacterium]